MRRLRHRYALAVTLWQLWFRKCPFSDKAVAWIVAKVLAKKRPSLSGDDDGGGGQGKNGARSNSLIFF